MAGTIAGGKAAAATNKAKYGADFYAKIGAEGGKLGRTGGFFADPERARLAGQKGGRSGRRKYTEEQRKAQSDFMKRLHAEGKFRRKEQLAPSSDHETQ